MHYTRARSQIKDQATITPYPVAAYVLAISVVIHIYLENHLSTAANDV
jgi:hypothetical protein